MIDDPTNPENVAETICRMINSGEEKRNQYGINARKRVEDKFLVYNHIT